MTDQTPPSKNAVKGVRYELEMTSSGVLQVDATTILMSSSPPSTDGCSSSQIVDVLEANAVAVCSTNGGL